MKKIVPFRSRIALIVIVAFTFIAVISKAQVSGAVYKDFDSNGSRSLPNEIGIKNVLVSAFVGSSNVPITTRTDLSGNYSFSTTDIPAGSKARIEFTDLGISNSGKKGTDSGTSVQFVTGGSSNVNLGIISSDEYCNLDGLELFATCYVNGDPLLGGSAGEDAALVVFPYNASGLAGVNGSPYPTVAAKTKEVGSVWGTDYQRSTKIAVTSAIVRRHSGLGPLGTGGIYKIDFNTDIVSPLVDLKTLGIDTGPDPHVGLPADMTTPNEDSLTIYAVAKTGIGGITFSRDEKTLYAVNLYDRKVYSFFVGKPATTPSISSVKSYTIPDPCGDGDYRPWAIKQYGGKIYVGVVCTAETSQDSTKLKAVIYQLDPVSGVFTLFYEFPLDYKKGPLDHTGACISNVYWKPWIDKFPNGCASFFDGTHTVNFAMYASAILTDIEFDGDGSILVGFMDRHGLMAGFRNMRPKDDGQRYDGFVGGDILRIYNNNGVFEMESNGKAGDRIGSGVGNDQGPGGGEFYGDDVWKFFGNPAHSEIVNGGLMIVPGTGEVVASAMDPVDEIYQAAGMRVFSNFDGKMKRGYALYSNKIGTLGKSGGAGDFKSSCTDAPIEFGNRLWNDADLDGVQDPDEVGIDGVTVTLHDMANGGLQVGTTTTANGGVYCFSDANVPSLLQFEHQYEIRLSMKHPILVNGKFYEKTLTDTSSGAESDIRDSDAQKNGDFLIIPFTTGLAGETNHTLDFGVVQCITPKAGLDVAFCALATTEQLPASGTNNRWKFLSGPATAEIDSLTGKITGLTANGTYKFILYYKPAGLDCSDTVLVIRQLQPIVIDKIGVNAICFETDTTSISATPIGGTWSALATNPAPTTINNNGKITGLTKIGIYEFVYKTIEGCEDTARVEVKACCTIPNAGQDLSFCEPKPTYDFTDATTYARWKFLSGPVSATIDSLNGKVAGMTKAGVYEFLLYYKPSGETCADTAKITLKEKPNAGTDLLGNNAICDTLSSFKLNGTPTGGIWTAFSTNPNPTVIDATGKVTGMSKAGIYEFIYTLPSGCEDSVKIEVKICCIKPSAGQDLSFCEPKATYDFVDATTNTRWKFLTGPVTATIDSLNGKVAGMTKAGVYEFLLYYKPSGLTCSDTVKITLKEKPNAGADFVGINAICDTLSSFRLVGTPQFGTWTANATNPNPTTIDVFGKVQGMSKAGIYEFIYTNSNGCADSVKIQVKLCCKKPNAGQDLSFCEPKLTHDFVDATANTRWKFLSGPAVATIDSLNGKVSGMTKAGVYEFLLFYKPSGETCSDTAKITLKEKPNAGADFLGINAICDTLSSFRLIGTPQFGIWTANATNPNPTTIDVFGKVQGMSKEGIYEFIYTNSNGCADSVKIQVKLCCKKPNAGQNLSFCQPISTVDLVDADATQRWQFLSGPIIANINATDGKVSGMTAAGIYKFVLFYLPVGVACSDTVEITIKLKPNAGTDLIGTNALCSPVSGYKLSATPSGGSWIGLGTNPETVTIDAGGNVSTMTKIGIYEFVYTLNGCSDSVKVELKACSIGSIGDFVWVDKQKDGIQQPNEVGIPNILVELYQTDINGNPLARQIAAPYKTTQTDENGKYLFTNLPSGTYQVKFVSSSIPASYKFSNLKNQGSDDNKDSDADPITGFSDLIIIDTTNPLKRNILDVDAALDLECRLNCVVVSIKKIR